MSNLILLDRSRGTIKFKLIGRHVQWIACPTIVNIWTRTIRMYRFYFSWISYWLASYTCDRVQLPLLPPGGPAERAYLSHDSNCYILALTKDMFLLMYVTYIFNTAIRIERRQCICSISTDFVVVVVSILTVVGSIVIHLLIVAICGRYLSVMLAWPADRVNLLD